MDLEKVKELIKIFKNSDYRNLFAAILLNENIDYLHDLEDLQEYDLKYVNEICDGYINGDYNLFSDEILEKINKYM